MITRHRSDNEDAIINQLLMETPHKNVNKDAICLLGSRPIDPKHRNIISNTEMKTKCQKYCENSKEMTFSHVCISTVCIKCVSRKG